MSAAVGRVVADHLRAEGLASEFGIDRVLDRLHPALIKAVRAEAAKAVAEALAPIAAEIEKHRTHSLDPEGTIGAIEALIKYAAQHTDPRSTP